MQNENSFQWTDFPWLYLILCSVTLMLIPCPRKIGPTNKNIIVYWANVKWTEQYYLQHWNDSVHLKLDQQLINSLLGSLDLITDFQKLVQFLIPTLEFCGIGFHLCIKMVAPTACFQSWIFSGHIHIRIYLMKFLFHHWIVQKPFAWIK